MDKKTDEKRREEVGLPSRPFLYTLDQVATLLAIDEDALAQNYVYFDGRSLGAQMPYHLLAHNLARPDTKPEWRITERELVRWLRRKKIRVYERTWI